MKGHTKQMSQTSKLFHPLNLHTISILPLLCRLSIMKDLFVLTKKVLFTKWSRKQYKYNENLCVASVIKESLRNTEKDTK